MSSLVRIGSVSVDINDPCAVLTELRKAELTVATGGAVSMTRFGEDEVRFTDASSAKLAGLIAKYEGLCDRKCGRRRRYAARVRWSI
ncbi:MAG TPA: hypothetical protein VGO22_19250 [Pseudorhizobium sp.]|jgi:hypothetical protein|nr:hypothetical protein [Pseudorhizobium sp.]